MKVKNLIWQKEITMFDIERHYSEFSKNMFFEIFKSDTLTR